MILERVPVPWHHENLVVKRIKDGIVAKVVIPEKEELELGCVSIDGEDPVLVNKDEWRIDTSTLTNQYFAYTYWTQVQFRNKREGKKFKEFEAKVFARYSNETMFSDSQLFWRTIYGVLHNYSIAGLSDKDFSKDWEELNGLCAENAKTFHPHYLAEHA